MAIAFNSETKKWERSTTVPTASSIPTAPTTVQQPTPVTYTQQTDPAKAKISSIGTQTSGTPQTTTNTTTTTAPKTTTPVPAPTYTQPGQQAAYDRIGPPKPPKTTEPSPLTQTTTQAPGMPAGDTWIGQSRTEEQDLQDNINKTQEELNNLKNREDALSQAEYLKKTKELQEYQAKQKQITDKQKAMSEEQAQIQSSAKLREAQRSLSQLKRNTAYLSSQGLGQSAGALDAFSQQISNAEQVYKEMQQYEQYAEEMRKLGYERDSNAYERSMKEQQDELDKYVSDTIQTIFNNMSAAEMAGQMDTVDEVDAFATKYFNSIDTDIANMTRKQIQIAEQKMALQVAQLAEVKKFVANKSTINKDMSTAQGYYVDGNGSPIISATTGTYIPIPQDPPREPIRDAKTGQLVSFSFGENGEIVADVQQVIDQPTFSANTIQNMVQAVANGTMTVGQALDVLPPDAQQQFLDKIGSVVPQSEYQFKTIGGQAYSFDPATGQSTPIMGGATPVMGGATGDLRGLASQFPGQARAKNNNPAGITWNSNFDKGLGTAKLLQEAGITYEKGTARPSSEGGNYVSFPTIEEGLLAQRIMMTQTYGNSTVNQMLSSWVGTGEGMRYASQVSQMAGVPGNVKVNQLNDDQLSALQFAKIQKESPGLAKLLGGGQQQGGPTGSLGIPISYERSVKNLVPATLMNSEVELKQLNETIQSMHKAGIPEADAALYFMGFNIQDQKNKELAKNLVGVGRGLPDDMSAQYVKTISDFINAGNIKGAVQKAETTAMAQAKKIEGENFVSDSKVKTAYSRANTLESYINSLDSSPVGVVSGSIEKWLGKLKGKEAQNVRTQVTQMVSKMRNDLIGASATESEIRMIEPIIPDINDSPANFMIKLQNLKTAPLTELNNMRETYGLPQLDGKTLLDSNTRVNLYGGATTPTSTQQQNTQQTTTKVSPKAKSITSSYGYN